MKHDGGGDEALLILGWIVWAIVVFVWASFTISWGWLLLAFSRTSYDAALDLVIFVSAPALLIVTAVSLKQRQWPGVASLLVVVPAVFIPFVPLILRASV
jgi:hypothetical protein